MCASGFAPDGRWWDSECCSGCSRCLIRVPLHYVDDRAASAYHVSLTQIDLNTLLINGGKIPADVSELPPTSPAHFDRKQWYDAWNHKLRIKYVTVDGAQCAVVYSAGRDGRFGTRDDLIAHPMPPSVLSQLRVKYLQKLIHTRLDTHQSVPADLQALGKLAGLKPDQLRDGWGRPLRLTLKIDKGISIYTITSADQDGNFESEHAYHQFTTY